MAECGGLLARGGHRLKEFNMAGYHDRSAYRWVQYFTAIMDLYVLDQWTDECWSIPVDEVIRKHREGTTGPRPGSAVAA